MRRRLDGMVAIITGASAGIGSTLAEQLAARGVKLALAARRVDRLEELNRRLGGAHLCVQVDVSRAEDCERLVSECVGRFGRIDVIVANAGYGLVRNVAETSPQEMRQIFQTNVFGTTDLIHAAAPHLLANEVRDGWRGHILIVSSAIARRSLPQYGAYAATKAAQLSLAESLRVELKPRGVAVTSVHPIGTTTEFFDQADRRSDVTQPRKTLPGEKMQTPHTVAEAMVRAIEKPRPEVWTSRPTRWLLAAASLFPGAVDRVVARKLR